MVEKAAEVITKDRFTCDTDNWLCTFTIFLLDVSVNYKKQTFAPLVKSFWIYCALVIVSFTDNMSISGSNLKLSNKLNNWEILNNDYKLDIRTSRFSNTLDRIFALAANKHFITFVLFKTA